MNICAICLDFFSFCFQKKLGEQFGIQINFLYYFVVIISAAVHFRSHTFIFHTGIILELFIKWTYML